MKERPIIFEPESVQAIIEGRKTQTRRVIKGPPSDVTYAAGIPESGGEFQFTNFLTGTSLQKRCPYGGIRYPWDRLWVRRKRDGSFAWKKADAFLYLAITNIRVERLQDISEADAEAEGVSSSFAGSFIIPARDMFMGAWIKINGKKHPWESNPWVWVIEFKRVTK